MTTQAYFLPQSLDEALGLLAEHGAEMLVMAGGTLAMPLINAGISLPEKVMGLRRAGLNYAKRENGSLKIGAAATLTQMLALEDLPLLQEAARNVGGWAIRNMATVGGNLFAPPPAGDFAVALLALDAQVVLASAAGERTIPLEDFYTGFMTTGLRPGELLAELKVRVPPGRSAYLKLGRRHANTPAVVSVAVHLLFAGQVVSAARLALNGVGPHPFRAKQAEESLVGRKLQAGTIDRAARLAAGQCQPFTDAIATDWYRRKMAEVFVRRALNQVAT